MSKLGDDDLKGLCGASVQDNGDLHNLKDIVEELGDFVETFSTHSMNETALYFQGQEQAYLNVIDYLKRVGRIEDNVEEDLP